MLLCGFETNNWDENRKNVSQNIIGSHFHYYLLIIKPLVLKYKMHNTKGFDLVSVAEQGETWWSIIYSLFNKLG